METKLSITGMTCHHCVHAVTKALQSVGGVEKVSVSLDSGLARVEGKAATDALIQAVKNEGYNAQIAN